MTVRFADLSRTVRANLIGAPDQEQKRDGRPFIADRLTIRHSLGGAIVTAHIEGRAIKANGEIGVANRGRSYTLAGEPWYDPAPEWLTDALAAAGVTW